MKCSLTPARIKTFFRTAVNCWMVHKWGSCRGKKRYVTYDLAENARRNYNSRVALQFGAFQAFWCKHHHAWHLGHVGSGLKPKRETLRANWGKKQVRTVCDNQPKGGTYQGIFVVRGFIYKQELLTHVI